MNPQCASCKKTVYPMEKLNCLDKFWHKGCFRCQVCGMTLNMKNYKGFNKEPYCPAHYPTQKFTAVADTPESRRLAANTAIQSQVKYHADFEKQKGSKITVADDPETMRAKKSAQIASEVSYRGVKEQRNVQEMHRPEQTLDEERRASRNSNVGRISDFDPAENQPSPYSARSQQMPTVYDSQKGGRDEQFVDPYQYQQQQQQQQQRRVEEDGRRGVGKISDYDPERNQWGSVGQGFEERIPGRFEPVNQFVPPPQAQQPPAPGQPQHHTWQPPSQQKSRQQQKQQANNYGVQPGYGQQGHNGTAKPDHVSIIINVTDEKGSYHQPGFNQPPLSHQQGYQLPSPNQPNSPTGNPNAPAPGYGQIFGQPGRNPQQPWPSRQVPQQYRNEGQGGQQMGGQKKSYNEGFRQLRQTGFGKKAPPPPAPSGPKYRAIYDYNKADDDEVSFQEGDIFVDIVIIDSGWMEGRNTRTNQYGMLPSNYVEQD